MQKKILISLVIVSFCCIVLTTGVLFAIQTIMARNAANEMFMTQLNNVVERIHQNQVQIDELTNSTKEDYISRARALATMIELNPGIIGEPDKVNEIADALNVDEVYIIDESGIVLWGTLPQFYGMDFNSSEQTRPFLAILDDPSLEIVQDLMPNGSEGLMRQYAGVSLIGMKGIAQIGMASGRLEDALKNNKICKVIDGIIVGNTGYLFAVDAVTNVIVSHPLKKLVGTELSEPLSVRGFITIDGQRVCYGTQRYKNYILAAVLPISELYSQRMPYTIIFMFFMTLLFSAFCIIVSAYINRSVVNGITDTVRTLEAISAGNLNLTANVRSTEEFEKLSDGINLMLQSIKTKMVEAASLAGDLRRLGAIVAIADAGIIVKNKDGIVLEWNIGAENILGYKPEEIIGKTTKAYAPKEAHAGIDEIEERLQSGEHIAHLEVIREHKDGRRIHCSASYTPIFDEYGDFSGAVAIFHDISDKKQIEQALQDAMLAAKQANSAKSSFLANMSHEIRTPLNGIIGFAELAADDAKLPENTRNYLEKIKLSGGGLLQIINDILDISKIEAGKMELENTPFSLNDVLDFCETVEGPRAAEKEIVLHFCSEPPLNKMLLGDPTKLRQILLNLLSNAIKFTNDGMVKLMASNEEADSSVIVHFEVKDNGIGMTCEQLQKVFEPFAQADSSTTRKYGGTGLGLAIAKSMVELMDGKLDVESAPGVGSKFSFSLKFETVGVPEGASDSVENPALAVSKPMFSGDILVCEDNIINQLVIKEHLSKIGLNATIAENGILGVEAVGNRDGKPFDLIFMDIHMPGMDGLEASRILKKIGNKSPIIALTANALQTDKDTYLSSGMTDYLAKPFTSIDLWECLLKYLTPVEFSDTPSYSVAKTACSAEYSAIDRQAGIELSGGSEKLYDELLKRFSKENLNTFGDISSALQCGDATLAHRLAHSLKGASETLGITGLQGAALALEKYLSTGKADIPPELIITLDERLNAVLAEITIISNDCGES